MKYIRDWPKAKRRHTAFWHGEREGSCLFSVTARLPDKEGKDAPRKAYANAEEHWTDGEGLMRRGIWLFEHTYYAGDALPIVMPNLGAAGHAGFFVGAKPKFDYTVWFEHTLNDYADLTFDKEGYLYQMTLTLAKTYVGMAQGDFIVSMPDTSGNTDALSHLRGPDRFMLDLMDDAASVKEAMAKVQHAWESIISDVYAIIRHNNDGGSSVGWLDTWAPGLLAQLQCDSSVMISADLFEEFYLDEIRAQSAFLEYSLYHLDGKAQVRHLDHLLSVKELTAIQWTNVAGQPPVTEYIPVLRRIQAAGKGLVLDCTPQQVPFLLENLNSTGLYIRTYAQTPREADDLVALTELLSHD